MITDGSQRQQQQRRGGRGRPSEAEELSPRRYRSRSRDDRRRSRYRSPSWSPFWDKNPRLDYYQRQRHRGTRRSPSGERHRQLLSSEYGRRRRQSRSPTDRVDDPSYDYYHRRGGERSPSRSRYRSYEQDDDDGGSHQRGRPCGLDYYRPDSSRPSRDYRRHDERDRHDHYDHRSGESSSAYDHYRRQEDRYPHEDEGGGCDSDALAVPRHNPNTERGHSTDQQDSRPHSHGETEYRSLLPGSDSCTANHNPAGHQVMESRWGGSAPQQPMYSCMGGSGGCGSMHVRMDQDRPSQTGGSIPPKHEIHVGNLASNTTDEQVYQVFSEIGRVLNVRLIRSFAFVEFEDPQAALLAIRNRNDYELNNRRLRVSPTTNSSHLEALAKKLGMNLSSHHNQSNRSSLARKQTEQQPLRNFSYDDEGHHHDAAPPTRREEVSQSRSSRRFGNDLELSDLKVEGSIHHERTGTECSADGHSARVFVAGKWDGQPQQPPPLVLPQFHVKKQQSADDRLLPDQEEIPWGEDPALGTIVGKGVRWSGTNPAATRVRADMRVLVGSSSVGQYPGKLTHDDVVIVPELFGRSESWTCYYDLVQDFTDLQQERRNGCDSSTLNDPYQSKTFQRIKDRLCKYFQIREGVLRVRLKWFKDGGDWEALHEYPASGKENAEADNITVCASFGASRELAFVRARDLQGAAISSRNGDCGSNDDDVVRMDFPQENNGALSFGRNVNTRWRNCVNAVAREHDDGKGCIVVVLWGLAEGVVERDSSMRRLLYGNANGNTKESHP